MAANWIPGDFIGAVCPQGMILAEGISRGGALEAWEALRCGAPLEDVAECVTAARTDGGEVRYAISSWDGTTLRVLVSAGFAARVQAGGEEVLIAPSAPGEPVHAFTDVHLWEISDSWYAQVGSDQSPWPIVEGIVHAEALRARLPLEVATPFGGVAALETAALLEAPETAGPAEAPDAPVPANQVPAEPVTADPVAAGLHEPAESVAAGLHEPAVKGEASVRSGDGDLPAGRPVVEQVPEPGIEIAAGTSAAQLPPQAGVQSAGPESSDSPVTEHSWSGQPGGLGPAGGRGEPGGVGPAGGPGEPGGVGPAGAPSHSGDVASVASVPASFASREEEWPAGQPGADQAGAGALPEAAGEPLLAGAPDGQPEPRAVSKDPASGAANPSLPAAVPFVAPAPEISPLASSPAVVEAAEPGFASASLFAPPVAPGHRPVPDGADAKALGGPALSGGPAAMPTGRGVEETSGLPAAAPAAAPAGLPGEAAFGAQSGANWAQQEAWPAPAEAEADAAPVQPIPSPAVVSPAQPSPAPIGQVDPESAAPTGSERTENAAVAFAPVVADISPFAPEAQMGFGGVKGPNDSVFAPVTPATAAPAGATPVASTPVAPAGAIPVTGTPAIGTTAGVTPAGVVGAAGGASAMAAASVLAQDAPSGSIPVRVEAQAASPFAAFPVGEGAATPAGGAIGQQSSTGPGAQQPLAMEEYPPNPFVAIFGAATPRN